MHLTDAHDGVPFAFPIVALVLIAGAGLVIALVIRSELRAVDCCPHPDLDDEEPQSVGVTT